MRERESTRNYCLLIACHTQRQTVYSNSAVCVSAVKATHKQHTCEVSTLYSWEDSDQLSELWKLPSSVLQSLQWHLTLHTHTV